MTDCLFCKIARGDIPSEKLYEDELLYVIRDIHPKAPVHLLIIPKEHIPSIKELERTHQELAFQLLYTAKKMAEAQNLLGYKLIFNVGKEGGQEIDHLHLHLLGGTD
jgi:histidine triad (HIT) family protein